ncbi:hypothetical protein BGZ65_001439 [Modicella reniformis]|uniref:RING-type E3 ubiquitin transferase n=1 Tax=Modicella reniformis TaxID=1440133 RepID=A0A9P6MJS4_9FUNG|nr:hypothetical protein BGZ65_001439 [Modicella reniformis]
MSSDSEPLTLPLEDEITDLSEDDRATGESTTTSVNLVSLVPSYKDISLTKSKTVIGRNSIERTEGDKEHGSSINISRSHCEISSRSMEDADAAIWINDMSSNGVWVNGKKIAKNEPIKIFNKDIISFVSGPTNSTSDAPAFLLRDERGKIGYKKPKQESEKRPNEQLGDDPSTKELEPDVKKPKVDEESVFEKEFNCGICHDIMHKALVLQPCLHSFCKECCKTWLQNSAECPACRRPVIRTKRDFRLNNLISVFLENRPHLKRDDIEDGDAASDTSDIIEARSRNNVGEEDYSDEDEYDDDDDDDGQLLPLPGGLPVL